MILAFVVAGGFFTWLFFEAAPIEVQVVEGGTDEVESATAVTLDVFGMNPLAHEGMAIRLSRLGVQTILGAQAFFVEGIPNQANPYLVKLTPEAASTGLVLESGATVSVAGMVHAMSNPDSVAEAWVASGAIREDSRLLVAFAESFFEARSVTLTAQAPQNP